MEQCYVPQNVKIDEHITDKKTQNVATKWNVTKNQALCESKESIYQIIFKFRDLFTLNAFLWFALKTKAQSNAFTES